MIRSKSTFATDMPEWTLTIHTNLLDKIESTNAIVGLPAIYNTFSLYKDTEYGRLYISNTN